MPYIIRTAEEKDISPVYDFINLLEETNFDIALFEIIYKENINSKNCVYLVAESEDESIIGFISCHIQNLLHHCGKVAEIQELFVEEPYRGAGLGHLLIEEMEKRLRLMNCVSFEVTAQHKRTATHSFYEKNGFRNTHHKFVKQLS